VVYGREKVNASKELAEEYGFDLSRSFAYGDSITDLPLLAKVEHPVAVNPDIRLNLHAKKMGWKRVKWTRMP